MSSDGSPHLRPSCDTKSKQAAKLCRYSRILKFGVKCGANIALVKISSCLQESLLNPNLENAEFVLRCAEWFRVNTG